MNKGLIGKIMHTLRDLVVSEIVTSTRLKQAIFEIKKTNKLLKKICQNPKFLLRL